MNNLDFLSNVTLETVKVAEKKVATDKLPTEGDLRVFANGKVYPSVAFAEANKLDFSKRVNVAAEGEPEQLEVAGNGLDIFRSTDWGMIGNKLPQEVLFIAVVPKSEPKVDMWGSCKYDPETGEPKSSILTQGSNTFAKTVLVGYLAEVLGVVWEATEFVDLKVVTEHTMKSSNDVYHLPKTVSTGKRKGEADSVRRENLSIHPLVLVTPINASDIGGPEPEEVVVAQAKDAEEAAAHIAEADSQDWAESLQKTE